MNDIIEVPVYLQVAGRDPGWNTQTNRWDGPPRRGTVVGATKTRPTRVPRGTVVVKVLLRIPRSVYAVFLPQVVVDVPEAMVDAPLEAEAADPTEAVRRG